MQFQPPFTIESLASHWKCSENHIRNLIASSQLKHFRIGPKLIRIPVQAVLDFEKECLNQFSPNTEALMAAVPIIIIFTLLYWAMR